MRQGTMKNQQPSVGGGGMFAGNPQEVKTRQMGMMETGLDKVDNTGSEVQNSRKIFVGGLPPTLKQEEFRDYFEKFGEIEDCVVMLDRNTGRPRGNLTLLTGKALDLSHSNWKMQWIMY
jgi:hypothetical protein